MRACLSVFVCLALRPCTAQIKAILQRLKTDWPGLSYDLLSRNCCHFCEVLCQELEVKPVPGEALPCSMCVCVCVRVCVH